jgi:hypothetical protein
VLSLLSIGVSPLLWLHYIYIYVYKLHLIMCFYWYICISFIIQPNTHNIYDIGILKYITSSEGATNPGQGSPLQAPRAATPQTSVPLSTYRKLVTAVVFLMFFLGWKSETMPLFFNSCMNGFEVRVRLNNQLQHVDIENKSMYCEAMPHESKWQHDHC